MDLEFCKVCGRPYAPEGIGYCDSCIKDLFWKASKKLKMRLYNIENKKSFIENFDPSI